MTTYFDRLWFQVIEFLPNIFGALIVLLVGWIIAEVVAAITRQGLLWLSADRLLLDEMPTGAKAQVSENTRPSNVAGSLVKWLIILGAAGVAAETLGLAGVSTFIGSLLAYVPNIIVAIIILVIGFITAKRVSELVQASGMVASLPDTSRYVISRVARYGIIVFTIMAALTQLNIVPRLIEIAFAGLVLTLALAFGLGGREHARDWIANLKRRTPENVS